MGSSQKWWADEENDYTRLLRKYGEKSERSDWHPADTPWIKHLERLREMERSEKVHDYNNYRTYCSLLDIECQPRTGLWRSHWAELKDKLEKERTVKATSLSHAAKSEAINRIWGEPGPIPTDEQPVWEAVIADMQSRDRFGRQKYGTPLQASNGRDHLKDAYEEALDLCVYLKSEIMRREIENEQGTTTMGEPTSD